MTLAGAVDVRPAALTEVVPAAAVLPGITVAAGFEIGMLLRCARTGSGRYEHSAAAASTVEFGRAAAAERLVALLGQLGVAARGDEFAAGVRHRYTVHRVVCADLDAPLLGRSWVEGYRRLCTPDGYRTPMQVRLRAALAVAAWRAAMLAGNVRARGGKLAVRVSDADTALVLVRAARLLGVPVSLRGSAGRHLVEVVSGNTLRDLALGSGPAGADPVRTGKRLAG